MDDVDRIVKFIVSIDYVVEEWRIINSRGSLYPSCFDTRFLKRRVVFYWLICLLRRLDRDSFKMKSGLYEITSLVLILFAVVTMRIATHRPVEYLIFLTNM